MSKRIILFTVCILILPCFIYGQGKLKGTVKDSVGAPVKDASVLIENTKYIATTNDKGNYEIDKIPAGDYNIIVSLVGYNAVELKTTIKDNEATSLDFHLNQKVHQLEAVHIIKSISPHGMGHLAETHDAVIYSGMKTEVLVLDSMDANTAQNNPREVLGRVPGSNYSETEGGGFPSNGIAFRGLRPTQSIEVQTRQNGYNIAADLYGYPETYYAPPLECVERIEVVRGASSLQFGPQFGGIINYVLKEPSADKPFEGEVRETGGSYGFIGSLYAFDGTYKKWSYSGFVEYKASAGWRDNSDYRQVSGFGRLDYHANSKLTIGLQYTLLRNRIQMAGGLDDAQFAQDPQQSFRTRNWLESPWNIIALTVDDKISENTVLSFKSSLNISARNLVWKNEDGGPQSPDTIGNNYYTVGNNTFHYVGYGIREVQKESFTSSTNELRLLTNYNLFGGEHSFATGIRYFQGALLRQGGGPGSPYSDFDLNLYYGSKYGYDLSFTTTNVALFVENTFHIGKRISITPGFRYEYITSAATGYVSNNPGDSTNVSENRGWYIPLGGLNIQIRTSNTTNIYANASQAYEPITYENLTPYGSYSLIDPNLKDVSGVNCDFGWRGNIKTFLNFDVGLFYLFINGEQGIETRKDVNDSSYTYVTNIGNAVHQGIEAYIEFNPFKCFKTKSKIGELSFFDSYCYDQAKYVSGMYTGNYEEQAPVNINRLGVVYEYKNFSATYVLSYTSESYADANNTVSSTLAEVGLIPAYTIMDISASLHIKKYTIKAGASNLTDVKYFNLRTSEYPGPGIIPAQARSIYVGIGLSF